MEAQCCDGRQYYSSSEWEIFEKFFLLFTWKKIDCSNVIIEQVYLALGDNNIYVLFRSGFGPDVLDIWHVKVGLGVYV